MNIEPPLELMIARPNWTFGTALSHAFALDPELPNKLKERVVTRVSGWSVHHVTQCEQCGDCGGRTTRPV
jgi:hypothetical protein